MGGEPDFALILREAGMDFALRVFFLRVFTDNFIKLCDEGYLFSGRVETIETTSVVGIVSPE